MGAWCFWFGFLVPLLWAVGSFWRVPLTRRVGVDSEMEKAVVVDDPEVERGECLFCLNSDDFVEYTVS